MYYFLPNKLETLSKLISNPKGNHSVAIPTYITGCVVNQCNPFEKQIGIFLSNHNNVHIFNFWVFLKEINQYFEKAACLSQHCLQLWKFGSNTISNNKKVCKQIMECSLSEYYAAIKNYHYDEYETWDNAYNFQPQR